MTQNTLQDPLLPDLEKLDFPTPNRVIIYHDSAGNKDFLCHGFLIVPTWTQNTLLELLQWARSIYGYNSKLHFNELSGRRWGPRDKCAEAWTRLGIEALKRKNISPLFRHPLNCRLGIIFFNQRADVRLALYGGQSKEKYVRWTETVINIALKGALHLCYSNQEPVIVEGFYTDGTPYHRNLSVSRILGRLGYETRSYVQISESATIVPIISDHRKSTCTSPEDAQLLQLTDLLLGAALSCISGSHVEGSKKERLSRPVRYTLNKVKRGQAFQYSGHFRSFSVSYATIKDGKWEFEDAIGLLKPPPQRQQPHFEQLSLF